jgi:hypothetical protein
MATCFVIQPFDNEKYDRRFDETYGPAIRAAGLEPYRVDRDPGVSIPISQIEDGIRRASVCFVEISEDNPNVWFEFGFAISEAKETVIVCDSQKRDRFPFDIQHRRVIKYSTNSLSAFGKLQTQITEALKAATARVDNLETLESSSPIQPKEGLSEHEISLLANIASETDADFGIGQWRLTQNMDVIGYTAIATQLGCRKLIRKGLVDSQVAQDSNGDDYNSYKLTSNGWDWLLANEDRLILKKPKSRSAKTSVGKRDDMDDEIPF